MKFNISYAVFAARLIAATVALSTIALTLLFVPTTSVRAAPKAITWHVTSNGDGAANISNCPSASNCRLRDAITAASTGDTIDFVLAFPTTITLNSGTLSFSDLNISGPGQNNLTISGNNASRVFALGGDTTIQNLTIQNGNAAGNQGGGIDFGGTGTLTLSHISVISNTAGQGGGIFNNGGIVAMNNVTISNNHATLFGGAIENNNNGGATRMSLTNSIVSNNVSDGDIGGIGNGGILTITNSTLSGNEANGSGGALYTNNTVPVAITNSAFSSNSATSNGGAIYTIGPITIDSSTLSGNSAYVLSCSPCFGGGIYSTGATTITNSSIVSNTAGSGGGGIHKIAATPLTLSGSTVSGNTAVNTGAGGGGISVGTGAMALDNVTISGNSSDAADSGWGGGILSNDAPATLNNVTITGNKTGSNGGGGIRTTGLSVFTFENTIIAGNTSTSYGPDCSPGGSFNSADYNLIQDPSDCILTGTTAHNITGQDPKLAPLASLGGPTQVHGLLSGSPALDKGNNATCLSTDQRGVTRPLTIGNPCDIGAFEGIVGGIYYLPNILKH